jgi:uncharacterized protein (TIGR00255 family)
MGELLSMTGFGRAECAREDLHVVAEIKAVNNRYLEISPRLSPTLNDFEFRAKEIVRNFISRGKIYLWLNDVSPRLLAEAVGLDDNLSSALIVHLRKLSASLGLKDKIKLEHLLHFAEQLKSEILFHLPPELSEVAEEALVKALKQFQVMRRAEGEALRSDFLERVSALEKGIAQAEILANGNPEKRLEKMRERISQLLSNKDMDASRLEMEAVLLVDRFDITEELVRLKSHCAQFRQMVLAGGPCGRRLGFLVQEMNREMNTAASKADIPELSHIVVELKEELERMREQAQNVE